MNTAAADICVVACAQAWRGDGAILASPMGLIPSLGARLARLTFSPELLVTDGEAMLLDADETVEGWMPYRDVLRLVATGRRHMMMGAAQLDRYGNQNISSIGDWARPKAQLLGVRGAPGNTINHPVSYWVPRHSPRAFVERVDMVSGIGYDRTPPAHELRLVVTDKAVLDFGGSGHSMRLVSVHPGVTVEQVQELTGFPLNVSAVSVTPAPSQHRAGVDRSTRPGWVADGRSAVKTALTELLGIKYPIVQAAMGYVAGARLTAATSQAGLGIIASATMKPAEMLSSIKAVKARTPAPFGVNLRADAGDAAERIELIIAEKVPVASFALAPKKEMIARLRDAGVITIASVGARRHAEKVAGWGIDAVIATGGEGGGHTGAVPTSLLIPQIVDAVEIPVIAAGGYFDGRGLVAALAYGAAGIAMGTRFLLTSDSPVADEVKAVYLAADVNGTVVTTKVDGVPHRVLRTAMVEQLDRAGPVSGLVRSVRAAAGFRSVSGLGWAELIRQGRAMRAGAGLSWAQVLMAANTPMLLKAAMVDGRPDLGLMSSGQVAGLIEDLPSAGGLIESIMAQARERIAELART